MAAPIPSDDIEHIVRTSKEWDSSAMANWPIPRGCLCIELTSKNQTKLKVGEGDKFYRQLPYVGGDGGDLSNYYTKEEINNLLSNLNRMAIMSTSVYDNKNQLPKNGNKLGDVRFVANPNPSVSTDPIPYLWNGTKWIAFGSFFEDMSKYVTRAEIIPRVEQLERVAHTHTNKTVLDQTTAPYTREEKTKLASLKNYDDTVVKRDINELQRKAHTHANMDILNQTTAPFTSSEKEKLASLKNYKPFIGTDGEENGKEGLVPEPLTTDVNKFLSSDGTWKTIEPGGIQPATRESIGGVIVGDGLDVDQQGVLSVVGGGSQSEYVAGDGISIDQGSTESTDITSLSWEQGSIDPNTGEHDDFTLTVIRSPMIEVGLTNMLNVSAQDTSDNDMRWKASFYDSNQEFVEMVSSWQTLSDNVIRPENARYVVILLRKDAETEIDENDLKACEISWPIEIGKYVITNTGVTHVGLNENGSIICVENGSTNTVLEFSQDLDVTNGVVSIPDYHRLVLNVEE